jgi:hypothetical protein
MQIKIKFTFLALLFSVLFSSNIAAMEMGTSRYEASLHQTSGTLSFAYDEKYPLHCEKLEDWLVKKIKSNTKANDLLDLSLNNGNLKVSFMNEHYNHGSYLPKDRVIQLKIEFLTRMFPDTSSLTESLLNSDFGCNHILRTFIFELGNSVNNPVIMVDATHYSDAETYARAMEIAEFETQSITIPVFDYGVEFCQWHKDAFIHSPIEELKRIAYEETDEHYQFYVAQYNNSYWPNSTIYHIRKLWDKFLSAI